MLKKHPVSVWSEFIFLVHGPQAESCENKCKPPSSKEGIIFVDLMNDNQNKHKLLRLAESTDLLS